MMVDGDVSPIDFARFLREVAEATTRHQATVEAQTKDGSLVWLESTRGLPGVRTPYLEKPKDPQSVLLEVSRPGSPPDRPDLPPPEHHTEVHRREAEEYERRVNVWERHRRLYDDIFGARTPSDSHELVFALGLLVIHTDDGKVLRRHLLTAPVDVELNRSSQALTVTVNDAPRLELNWTDGETRAVLGDARGPLRSLQDAQTYSEVDGALVEILSSFGLRGKPLDQRGGDQIERGGVRMAAGPALMLRRRDTSFLLELLQQMQEDMEMGGYVSEPFSMIVSPTHPARQRTVEFDRVALPLPANAAQRAMIAGARREPHLVIQGPPGTGKTHTIANLVAVLMAEGRRVLVTAENERTLGEIQDKLPEEMRPLMLPMLKERGTGSLQVAVNALTTRASRAGSSEDRARAEHAVLERLSSFEEQIRLAEEQLSNLVQADREERSLGDLVLPLAGHLLHLGERVSKLGLVDRYLSADGSLADQDARDLIELTATVSENHRNLARHRFPDGLMAAPEFATWIHDYRSELSTLGDPGSVTRSSLVDQEVPLAKLATDLHGLPPTSWVEIGLSASEFSEAENRVADLAQYLDSGVVVEDPDRKREAIELCEEYLALDAGRFDEPLPDLVHRYRLAEENASTTAKLGTFMEPGRADELIQACQQALNLIRRDRSGLLKAHVTDYRERSYSAVNQLVIEAGTLVEDARAIPPGLPVEVTEGAPAIHELLRQSLLLREHLSVGGRMDRLVGKPKAVRDAEPLLHYVKVGGAPISTLDEVERAVAYLRQRRQISVVEAWVRDHELELPAGLSHHEWLTAIVGIPAASEAIRAACSLAEELVRFASGSVPDDPEVLLSTALATVSRELADALMRFGAAARVAPAITLSGSPIRSRADAEHVLAAIRADVERRAAHGTLPVEWAEVCDPVDTTKGDTLVRMLRVAAAAATIPGRLRVPRLSPSGVHEVIEMAKVDHRRETIRARHDELIRDLQRRLAACAPQSPATRAVGAALEAEDAVRYRNALQALDIEREQAAEALRLAELRVSAGTHPRLLQGFDLGEEDALVVLRDVESFEKLRDYRSAVLEWREELGSAEAIHEDLRRFHSDARRAERELAGRRCWNRAVGRVQERRELRSALSALANAMDAVPKTRTAKTYPARVRALRDATRSAAPAIPCWVMTIDRIAEVLGYPVGEDRFDVVIIDEASQVWFPAIFLYAIADQVIVVGDKLQISPSQVMKADQLAAIAAEHIPGHRLQDRAGDDLSLYDVAEIMTGPEVMVDHFRCVPEIIHISNRLSYEPMGRRLLPSRTREPGALEPVIHERVQGKRQGQGANEPEAQHLVSKVVACHADPRYEGMDFGVVVVGPSPMAHIKYLRQALLDTLGPLAMRERNLEVGTASQFQGGERNVMFLSLVVAAGSDERIRVWPHEHTGRNRRRVQQLNVAVSRAKDQLWIFHSFDRSQLDPRDARSVLLEKPKTDVTSLEEQLAACHSRFERDVVLAIAERDPNLVIRTQVEALGYAIDIVVEDGSGHRLAVECDGDAWHSTPAQIRVDLYRQRTLESIGWRFHRFLASEWYSNPQGHVEQIMSELVKASPSVDGRRLHAVEGNGDASGWEREDPEENSEVRHFEEWTTGVSGPLPSRDDEPHEPVVSTLWDGANGFVEDRRTPAERVRAYEEKLEQLGVLVVEYLGVDDEVVARLAGETLERLGRLRRDFEGSIPQRRSKRTARLEAEMMEIEAELANLGQRVSASGATPAQAEKRLAGADSGTKVPKSASSRGRTASTGAVDPETPPQSRTPTVSRQQSAMSKLRERNKALAAALRAENKEPNGEVWWRAKKLVEEGMGFEEAARRA